MVCLDTFCGLTCWLKAFGPEITLRYRLPVLAMVIRTIKKDKENLPYQQQSVVNFFCIAEYHGSKWGGSITAEKRDDNGKKIAYQVEIYGSDKRRVISCADVKLRGPSFQKALQELKEEAEMGRNYQLFQNWQIFREKWSEGREARFYGGFS